MDQRGGLGERRVATRETLRARSARRRSARRRRPWRRGANSSAEPRRFGPFPTGGNVDNFDGSPRRRPPRRCECSIGSAASAVVAAIMASGKAAGFASPLNCPHGRRYAAQRRTRLSANHPSTKTKRVAPRRSNAARRFAAPRRASPRRDGQTRRRTFHAGAQIAVVPRLDAPRRQAEPREVRLRGPPFGIGRARERRRDFGLELHFEVRLRRSGAMGDGRVHCVVRPLCPRSRDSRCARVRAPAPDRRTSRFCHWPSHARRPA